MDISCELSTPSQDPNSGHYWPAREMPIKCRFAGGSIVAKFYMLTGLVDLFYLMVKKENLLSAFLVCLNV